MIELRNDSLVFTFPEVHPKAKISIEFQRTLRIPDDDKEYPLPPGLGRFPLKHVDDYPNSVPPLWIDHGGVMLPMYQSEALWLNFSTDYISERGTDYPFAVKIAAGKINAVTGDDWTDGLHRNPQDYMISTKQPWLDGYCIEKGIIRQFVAMPLGSGYSAEEQITGEGEHGGIQIVVYPMKRRVFEKRFPKRKIRQAHRINEDVEYFAVCEASAAFDMGLAPGGRMRQEIYEDPFKIDNWEMDHKSRCFVHLTNSLVWRSISGEEPPTVPFTSQEYNSHGLPWFEYYSDNTVSLEGAKKLNELKSVAEMGKEKGDNPLPENESINPVNIVKLRSGLKENQVREGTF